MTVIQRLTEKMQQLPEDGHKAALDFVEFLLKKQFAHEAREEDADWNAFSFQQAMRGFENDDLTEYTKSDLKEKWQ